MKTLTAIALSIWFVGCIVPATAPEEAPPPATLQEVPAHTMFDTLTTTVVWSRDERFLYASSRAGLVQVECATGTTRIIDPQVRYYDRLTLSGSGDYLYCLTSTYRYDTLYYHQWCAVLRYRLSDFAADTVAAGWDMFFIPSPASDEIACASWYKDSLTIINPSTGLQQGIGGNKPIVYSRDGSDLLVGKYYDVSSYSVLHRDWSLSPLNAAAPTFYYSRFENVVWGVEGIEILYSVYPDYGSVEYSVYNLMTGTTNNIGSYCYFSPDGSRVAYWRMNVTEWLYLIFYRVPSEADFIINISTLSTQSTQSYTVEHSHSPGHVSYGGISFSPSGMQVAFVYNGLLKTMWTG